MLLLAHATATHHQLEPLCLFLAMSKTSLAQLSFWRYVDTQHTVLLACGCRYDNFDPLQSCPTDSSFLWLQASTNQLYLVANHPG